MQTLRNKNRKKVLLILSIITSSFFYSCTKIDTRLNELPINNEEITNRFFATTAKTDPINFRIIEELKKINNRQEFITAFAKENGYPVWDKTIISFKKKNTNSFSVNNVNGQNDTTIIIPLVLANSQFVNAYIAADLNDSINANLFKAKDYKNCPFKTTTNNDTSATAEKLAFRMISLDFHVFGHTDFDITDNRLFAFLKNTNTSQTPLTRRIKNITLVNNFGPAVCFEYSYEEVYPNPFGVICPNGSACQWTHTVVQSTCIYFGDPMPHTITYTIPTYNSGTNTNPNSSGGTGGSGTPIGWNPIPINPAITYTLSTLGADIDGIEIVWFRASNHYLQAIEIQNYLIQNNNSPAAIALCWLHLNLMMSNPVYFNFVTAHHTTGNQNKIWWEDEVWLRQIEFQMPEAAFNFYMKHTKPENNKPEEFANRCDGIKEMAQRTAADPNQNERLGYITYDGKFIITGIGNGPSVEQNLRGKGNTLYYSYPLSLGMPTLNYYGMIIDTANQEIWIPLRAGVHTHPDPTIYGGVSINYPNAKSGDDLRSAQKTQNISPFFNNFVIEVNGNSFKTGQFDKDKNDMNYFNTHSSLSLTDICQFITP